MLSPVPIPTVGIPLIKRASFLIISLILLRLNPAIKDMKVLSFKFKSLSRKSSSSIFGLIVKKITSQEFMVSSSEK